MQDKPVMCNLSRKMSKVRWKPDQDFPCSKFLTGSWGEMSEPLPNIEDPQGNAVQLWKNVPNMDPIPLCFLKHSGDVTEMKFIDENTFLVSSSLGSLKLVKIVNDSDETLFSFKSLNTWSDIHTYKNGTQSALTSFARSKNAVVTVGDDGRIAVISLDNSIPLYFTEKADSCSLKCITFIDHKSVITGNSIGNLKVWDLSVKAKPQFSLPSSYKPAAINFIEQKPSQNHLLFAGSDDGSITVWDMRNSTSPLILNSTHMHSASELKFHPENPNHFFTCTTMGELWHWNTSPDPLLSLSHQWTGDSINDQLEVSALEAPSIYPLNSLDVSHRSIITSCDNQAVYIYTNSVRITN